MSERPYDRHEYILELLPDFAIGALNDRDQAQVSEHLAECAACQREFEFLLGVSGFMESAAPPEAATKSSLMARLNASESASDPAPPTQIEYARTRKWTSAGMIGWVSAAAAIVLLIGSLVWNQQLRSDLDDQDTIATLLQESGHALTDSELDSPVTAIMYVDPERTEALIIATNVQPAADGEHYVVWLFTQNGERINAGTIAPENGGSVTALVEAPTSYSNYWAVGVTVESDADVEAPTTPLVIGGWIQ